MSYEGNATTLKPKWIIVHSVYNIFDQKSVSRYVLNNAVKVDLVIAYYWIIPNFCVD